MRATGVLVVTTLILAASPAHAGDGFAVPPAKFDFGYLTFATADGTYRGAQWMVGLNWATIYPKRTRLDVGVGYVGAVFQNPFATTATHPTQPPVMAPTKDVKGGVSVVPEPDPTIALNGGYLELSTRVASGSHWRTWLSGRGELLSVDGDGSLGTAARVSTEVWSGVMAGDRGGLVVGVLSLGLWVEASARELGNRGVVTAASAGMSVRIPLLLVGK